MKAINTLNKWANNHNPYFLLDVMRWFLGIFLFYKGVNFMTEPQTLKDIIAPNDEFLPSILIYQYVTLAHFSGGVLIVFGLLTRLAIAVQIPILIGAVAVNFIVTMQSQNLITATAILLLSIFFLVVGSGKHSADYGLKMQM